MQNSVVSNDSPILSSNVKSLQDLKAESPNKKLDRESLKQVSLIYVTYCKKDTELEKNIYDEDFIFSNFCSYLKLPEVGPKRLTYFYSRLS